MDFQDLQTFFYQVTLPPRLQHLEISFLLGKKYDNNERRYKIYSLSSIFGSFDYTPLDGLFSRPPFQNLRSLTFVFQVTVDFMRFV